MARKLEVETVRRSRTRESDDRNKKSHQESSPGDSFVGEDPQFIAFLLRESTVVASHTIALVVIHALILQLRRWDANWLTSILTIPLRWLVRLLFGDINSYPGPPWMLLLIQSRTNVMPNLAYRISQQQMGLLTRKELLGVAAVHLVITTFLLSCVRRFVSLASQITAVHYGNDSLIQGSQEVLWTFLFVIGIRVVPILLTINRLSVHWTSIILYPLLYYRSSWGRSLNPLGSQAMQGENTNSCHLLGQIMGAVVAGHVMNRYFPEEKGIPNANSKYFL